MTALSGLIKKSLEPVLDVRNTDTEYGSTIRKLARSQEVLNDKFIKRNFLSLDFHSTRIYSHIIGQARNNSGFVEIRHGSITLQVSSGCGPYFKNLTSIRMDYKNKSGWVMAEFRDKGDSVYTVRFYDSFDNKGYPSIQCYPGHISLSNSKMLDIQYEITTHCEKHLKDINIKMGLNID
jgi:hypothetical protein